MAESNTHEMPIRFITGMDQSLLDEYKEDVYYNYSTWRGLFIVYERSDGSAGQIFVSNHAKLFQKVKFVSAPEESCIVWQTTLVKDGGTKTYERLIEVRIRRDWQFKT